MKPGRKKTSSQAGKGKSQYRWLPGLTPRSIPAASQSSESTAAGSTLGGGAGDCCANKVPEGHRAVMGLSPTHFLESSCPLGPSLRTEGGGVWVIFSLDT